MITAASGIIMYCDSLLRREEKATMPRPGYHPIRHLARGIVLMNTTKICTQCGAEYPATSEYFRTSNGRLRSRCKPCEREYDRIYREKNHEIVLQRTRDWRAENPEKSRQSATNWRLNNPEKFHQSLKNWRQANLEYARVYDKAYYWANREHELEQNRQYRLRNPRHYIYIPERDKEAVQRRRTKKAGLPFLWGRSYRRSMMEYWGHRCAICGQEPGLWHTLAEDHWIALSDPRPNNPGTVPWNMLPLCHLKKGGGGLNSCNQSKKDKDPIEWLTKRLGKKKARKKLAEIEEYFASIKLPEV